MMSFTEELRVGGTKARCIHPELRAHIPSIVGLITSVLELLLVDDTIPPVRSHLRGQPHAGQISLLLVIRTDHLAFTELSGCSLSHFPSKFSLDLNLARWSMSRFFPQALGMPLA
jgi:hypothetical protein